MKMAIYVLFNKCFIALHSLIVNINKVKTNFLFIFILCI